MAWVRIQEATPKVGWICCRFSSLLQEVFLRLLWFSILLITNISKFLKLCYFSIIRYLLFIHLGYVAANFISDLILLLFFNIFEHFLFNLKTYKQSSKNLSSWWVSIKIDLNWLDYIWLDTRENFIHGLRTETWTPPHLRRRKLGQVTVRKYLWDCYWEHTKKIGQ